MVRGGHGPSQDCSRAWVNGGSGRAQAHEWRAGLKFQNLSTARAGLMLPAGLAHVLCCFFCILNNFKLKNKGKEHLARRPAHACSCRCGPKIKFLDHDRPAAQVEDNGPGGASSGLVLERPGPCPPQVVVVFE